MAASVDIAANRRRSHSELSRLLLPASLYLISGALVLFGGYVLAKYLPVNRCTGHYFGYTSWLSNWDGQWYQFIAHRGYVYEDFGGYAPQVFFPLYPLLGWLLEASTPMRGQLPLVAISWLAAWGFCIVWLRYAGYRIDDAKYNSAPLWGLAIVLFWPLSYFLRVAYTESLYLFLLTLFFLGCTRQWRPVLLITLTGLLTATRPTAVLACAVLGLHLFQRTPGAFPRRILIAAGAGLASAWGILLYMAYLQWEFGDAFLFVTRQAAWNYQMPADAFFRRWEEMLSLRPAWQFLVDGSLLRPSTYPWNLQNRGMWLVAIALIAVGRLKHWLNDVEFAFCALTALLVYFTHGPKDMESIGRYVFTLAPLYLVMTRLLVAMPIPVRVFLLAGSAILLTIQSAHFRLWHCVF